VEATKRPRPYSMLAPVKSWKKTVVQEKAWRVRSSKRSTRYSITVEMRARRQRTANTQYPMRKVTALPR
jgi:hypothetical protein